MKKNLTSITGLAAVSILALSACGGDSPEGDTEAEAGNGGENGELTEITVGVLPIAPSVGIYYGIENGIFEEHGSTSSCPPPTPAPPCCRR